MQKAIQTEAEISMQKKSKRVHAVQKKGAYAYCSGSEGDCAPEEEFFQPPAIAYAQKEPSDPNKTRIDAFTMLVNDITETVMNSRGGGRGVERGG